MTRTILTSENRGIYKKTFFEIQPLKGILLYLKLYTNYSMFYKTLFKMFICSQNGATDRPDFFAQR